MFAIKKLENMEKKKILCIINILVCACVCARTFVAVRFSEKNTGLGRMEP